MRNDHQPAINEVKIDSLREFIYKILSLYSLCYHDIGAREDILNTYDSSDQSKRQKLLESSDEKSEQVKKIENKIENIDHRFDLYILKNKPLSSLSDTKKNKIVESLLKISICDFRAPLASYVNYAAYDRLWPEFSTSIQGTKGNHAYTEADAASHRVYYDEILSIKQDQVNHMAKEIPQMIHDFLQLHFQQQLMLINTASISVFNTTSSTIDDNNVAITANTIRPDTKKSL